MSFGIVAVYGHKRAAEVVFEGLSDLTNKPSDVISILSTDGKEFHGANEAFREDRLDKYRGNIAIGRLSDEAHPSPVFNARVGSLGAVGAVSNGLISNSKELERELFDEGIVLPPETKKRSVSQIVSPPGTKRSVSQIALHLLSSSKKPNLLDAVKYILPKFKGSYCFLSMNGKGIVLSRDRHGYRPLCIGTINGSPVVASETSSLDRMGAIYERDVRPGEIIVFDENGIHHEELFPEEPRYCIRELIFYARPGSKIFDGISVYKFRKETGRVLAEEKGNVFEELDYIVPVLGSAMHVALGVHEKTDIPIELALEKNSYSGRIYADTSSGIDRETKINRKYTPIPELVEGKVVGLIDDSILGGDTLRIVCKLIKDAGAERVYAFIGSPVPNGCCDFRETSKRMREYANEKKVLDYLNRDGRNVESVNFLSLGGMLALTPNKENFCYDCFKR